MTIKDVMKKGDDDCTNLGVLLLDISDAIRELEETIKTSIRALTREVHGVGWKIREASCGDDASECSDE